MKINIKFTVVRKKEREFITFYFLKFKMNKGYNCPQIKQRSLATSSIFVFP